MRYRSKKRPTNLSVGGLVLEVESLLRTKPVVEHTCMTNGKD